MHRIPRRLEAAFLALTAAAVLLACTSVEVWQPPANAGLTQAPVIEKSSAPSASIVPSKPVAPVTEPSAAVATPIEFQEGVASFESELKRIHEEEAGMKPGFIITGEVIPGKDLAVITLDAKKLQGGDTVRKLALHVPVQLLGQIGIETPSGIELLSYWLTSGRTNAGFKGSGTEEKGLADLQIRVKQITFPDGGPGVAIDIGNMKAASSRDFIMALRETDANFVEVVDGATGTRTSLRRWLEANSEVSFRTPEQVKAPLADVAEEGWAAFTSVREVGAAAGMTEEQGKALVPELKLTLRPIGLAGEGLLVFGTHSIPVRRCAAEADNALNLPLCRRDVTGLRRAFRASSGGAEPIFIEIRNGAAPAGIGAILMKAGRAMLTVDRGRIFFWKKTESSSHDGGRVFETARIDTAR